MSSLKSFDTTRKIGPQVRSPFVDYSEICFAEMRERKRQEDMALLERWEAEIEAAAGNLKQAAPALEQIRRGGLFSLRRESFEQYVREWLRLCPRRVRQLVDHLVRVQELAGSQLLPITEAQTRPLGRLKALERREAWERAVRMAEGRQPTSGQVREAAQAVVPRSPRLAGDETLEWSIARSADWDPPEPELVQRFQKAWRGMWDQFSDGERIRLMPMLRLKAARWLQMKEETR